MIDFKIILGFVAALMATSSAYLYTRDIFRGNTKPHIYTWLIWAILTIIGFLGQLHGGGGPGSWATGVTSIFTLFILALSFRYGTPDITHFDKICLVLALLSMIPWLLTQNAVLSVVLATLTDIVGFLPTMRKTWHAPKSESLGSMYADTLKHGLSLVSLQNYSLLTWFYPAGVLFAKVVIITEILYRKSQLK